MLARFRHIGFFCPVLLLLMLAAPAFSKGSDVEFHGTVVKLNLTPGANSTITVHLVGFDVTVYVNADTDVESHGDENDLSDIQVGDFIKISAFFSTPGLTAQEIEVLDEAGNDFRLRGLITGVRSTAAGKIITMLGLDVLVDSATKLDRRGSPDQITLDDLAANMFADVRGVERTGGLVARRLKVGNREDDAIRVKFSGKITAIAAGRLTIDTDPGAAVVLLGSSTVVTGTPAVGKFADVHGTLNSNLEVVATRVDIKANKDDDGHPPPMQTKFDRKTALTPVGSISSVKGSVQLKLEQKNGAERQEVEVQIQQGQTNAVYSARITIAGSAVTLGTIKTNAKGQGELELEGTALTSLFPAGKTVKDIAKVEILVAGTVVAQGVF